VTSGAPADRAPDANVIATWMMIGRRMLQASMPPSRPSPLPDHAVTFLQRKIDTMTQLETMLALHRGATTASEVARQLRIADRHATDELARLTSQGLVAADGSSYRINALTASDAKALDDLDRLYPTYRFAIVSAIFS
jgi:hypothetical protein